MVPLHLAVEKIATKRGREALEPPTEIPELEGIRQGITREEALKRLPSLLPKVANEFLRPSVNRWRLFQQLCRRITAGELVAYGIRTKPTLGSDLELVPSFLFRNPKIDLEHDAIENAGHRFELIEVGRPPPTAKAKPLEVCQQKKMGRPTKEAEIEEVVRKVLADPSAPRNRKALCDRIRELAVSLGKSVEFRVFGQHHQAPHRASRSADDWLKRPKVVLQLLDFQLQCLR